MRNQKNLNKERKELRLRAGRSLSCSSFRGLWPIRLWFFWLTFSRRAWICGRERKHSDTAYWHSCWFWKSRSTNFAGLFLKTVLCDGGLLFEVLSPHLAASAAASAAAAAAPRVGPSINCDLDYSAGSCSGHSWDTSPLWSESYLSFLTESKRKKESCYHQTLKHRLRSGLRSAHNAE